MRGTGGDCPLVAVAVAVGGEYGDRTNQDSQPQQQKIVTTSL